MKKSLSVIVITGNEEKNIADCLSSISWADEIVLVDSESRDRTVEIARKFTDKVFIRKWEGYAAQRQFALDSSTMDWVLSIDADERVSPELRKEIESILQHETDIAGYKIPRRNFFLGKWITTCFWYPDYQLRLFKRDVVKVIPVKVHEGFSVEGRIETLRGDIIHLTYKNLSDGFQKINNYSTLAAEERVNRRKIKAHHIVLHPIAAFITDFISRKGYRDGMHGFMVALLNMMTNLMMYMKMWEAQNIPPKNEDGTKS